MAITNFIPAIWSARLLVALQKSHIYAQAGIVNRDYEGEITAAGNTVKINSVGDPTIKTYTTNTDIDTPEELTSAQLELLINQAKYFNFAVDDVDNVQANIAVLDEAMGRAGYGLRNVVDVFMVTTMAAGVDADNVIGTALAPETFATVSEAYDRIVDLGVMLGEDDAPEDGRWVVVPGWYHGLLLKDNRFVASGAAAADERLINGKVGRVAGISVHVSNNVPIANTTDYTVMAGHPLGASYAEQILQMEAYRPERRFADAVKGLHVYGAKVVRPKMLARMIVTRPSL